MTAAAGRVNVRPAAAAPLPPRAGACKHERMPHSTPIEDMPPDARGRWRPQEEATAIAPVFDAVLRPNRSLSNPGFAIVMAILVGANLIIGGYFYAIGAWPVIGFMGLDIALVWLAFRLSYRQGLLCEHVAVDADEIRVARVLPSGHEMRWRLQTAWTRVAIDNRREHEVTVRLVSKGRALQLGGFLAPEEREAFGDALAAALSGAARAR